MAGDKKSKKKNKDEKSGKKNGKKKKSVQPVFDIVESLKARDEGMKRADDNANAEWVAAMEEIVVEVAKKHEYFTSDDVFSMALAREVPPAHENRALGPIMIRATRDLVCVRSNRPPVTSTRKSRHGCPLTVWRSLLAQASKKSLPPSLKKLKLAAEQVATEMPDSRNVRALVRAAFEACENEDIES
jgi:hypothetical protein